jgi:hypothetical protein
MNKYKMNPEAAWKNIIDSLGDCYLSLGPELTYLVTRNPKELMLYLGWYKFAAKMIGPERKVLVIDRLEGLGAWIVSCEKNNVTAYLANNKQYESAVSQWGSGRIVFKTAELNDTTTKKYDGVVFFDIKQDYIATDWDLFFFNVAKSVLVNGAVVAGGKLKKSSIEIKKIAKKYFKNVFQFGEYQDHPCLHPAGASLVVACGPIEKS